MKVYWASIMVASIIRQRPATWLAVFYKNCQIKTAWLARQQSRWSSKSFDVVKQYHQSMSSFGRQHHLFFRNSLPFMTSFAINYLPGTLITNYGIKLPVRKKSPVGPYCTRIISSLYLHEKACKGVSHHIAHHLARFLLSLKQKLRPRVPISY